MRGTCEYTGVEYAYVYTEGVGYTFTYKSSLNWFSAYNYCLAKNATFLTNTIAANNKLALRQTYGSYWLGGNYPYAAYPSYNSRYAQYDDGYSTSFSVEQRADAGHHRPICIEQSGCPTGYTTSISSCGTGYRLETNGTGTNGGACHRCVQRPCSDGGYVDSCNEGCDGNSTVSCSSVTYGGKTCYARTATDCGSGYRCENNTCVRNLVTYGCDGNCPNYNNRFCRVTSVPIASYYDNDNYYNLNNANGSCSTVGDAYGIHNSSISMVYQNGNFNYWSANNWCAKQGYPMITAEEVNNNINLLNQNLYTTDFWVDDGSSPASRFGSYYHYGYIKSSNQVKTYGMAAVCVVGSGNSDCISGAQQGYYDYTLDEVEWNSCPYGYESYGECGYDATCDSCGNVEVQGVRCFTEYGNCDYGGSFFEAPYPWTNSLEDMKYSRCMPECDNRYGSSNVYHIHAYETGGGFCCVCWLRDGSEVAPH